MIFLILRQIILMVSGVCIENNREVSTTIKKFVKQFYVIICLSDFLQSRYCNLQSVGGQHPTVCVGNSAMNAGEISVEIRALSQNYSMKQGPCSSRQTQVSHCFSQSRCLHSSAAIPATCVSLPVSHTARLLLNFFLPVKVIHRYFLEILVKHFLT